MRQPVIYLRKSLIKNADNDLDVHYRRCLARLTERGETNPLIIQEPEGHRSAYYSERRPGYQKLLQLLTTKSISTLYVNDRARLWRNDIEWLLFLYKCKQYDTEIIPVTEPPIGDVTDSNARLLEFLQGNRAQSFRDDLSKRHKDLKADLKAAGIFAGARAFGVNLVGSKFQRKLEPNQDFPIIVELLNLYVQGHGTPTIARELERRGYTWKDGARRVRPDPTIILNLIHHIERYQEFLDSTLYQKVILTRTQRAKSRANSRNMKHPPLLLRMVLTCADCGKRFYSKADYTRAGQHIGAYFHSPTLCSNPIKWHPADVLHQQFLNKLTWLDDTAQLEEIVTELCAPTTSALDHIHARARLITQLENLENAYLAGDLGELNQARPHYRKKKTELETKLNALPEPPTKKPREEYILRAALESLRDTLKQAATLDPVAANLTIRQLFQSIPIRGNDLLDLVWLEV